MSERTEVLKALYRRQELVGELRADYPDDVALRMVESIEHVPLGAAVAQRLQLASVMGGGYAAGSPGAAAREALRAVASWLKAHDAADPELVERLYAAADEWWDLP